MKFNDNLRNEIEYQDLKIIEIAKDLDVPYSTFCSYINYKNVLPRIDIAYKISKKLNVSLEYLMTGNEQDNYYISSQKYIKELLSLPYSISDPIFKIIHIYYELNKIKEK